MQSVEEQAYYLWVCSKCNTTNQEALLFCPNCAANEGLPNPEAAQADKTGKLTEVLGNAIDWSLRNAQIKPADVLTQAARRGHKIANLSELRLLPTQELEKLADNYVNSNRAGATGAGLTTGLPGGLAAFATIPADITALVYFALRCVNGISQAYSFEVESEVGQIVELLAFAYACRIETFVIGTRRLESFELARFLSDNPEYARVVKGSILKQLAVYLTVDFAKTSWASFLPVVGSVVNGMDHFWFLGEVSKRSKHFYRALLSHIAPAVPVVPQVNLITIEVREEQLAFSDWALDVYIVNPPAEQVVPPVLVLWEGAAGREIADRLAENGLAAWLPLAIPTAAQLTELLAYLEANNLLAKKPGLLAFGSGAAVALDFLQENKVGVEAVVIYNPLGESRELIVGRPVLVQWGEEAVEVAKNWAEKLRSDGLSGIVSVSSYPGVGYTFTDPTSPDYNRQATEWAWADTLEWFQRLR